jgi:predicted DNA-binding WGR domain protein
MTTEASQVAEVRVRYEATPEPVFEEDSFRLVVPTDGVRSAGFLAEVERPGVVRDALLTMGEILASDLRYKPQDRADYLAYLLSKGKRATQEVWNAQKAFLETKYGEATREEAPLDPILTVDQDGVALEVFSADESAYARLQLKAGQAYRASDATLGSTHVELSPTLLKAIGRMRSYRRTTLELRPSAGGDERAVRVPYRWIRAFGQVQAASTLPSQSFEIAPVDLYNVLLTLRMRRAKKPPRALRYELVPGEVPRLVLEPWDLVLEGTGGPFNGTIPQVVRTWGRKRLTVLSRLLPHAESVRVFLVGAGLPAYYVVDLGDATLTLALSGWTDSGWAGIATFDLLVAGEMDDVFLQQLSAELQKGPRTLGDLEGAVTGRPKGEVRQGLLALMQKGTVLHDVAAGTFRHRKLFVEALDTAALRFRDAREREAHRLLEVEGQVKLTRVHDLGGEGVRIEGEVEDRQAHRVYTTSFTLDREGRTVDASCTSPQFRRSGLREGPTVPMIALRLLYTRQQAELERARGTEEGRRLIRAETRTLIRRDREGAMTCRVSLDDRQVVVRWGHRPDEMRMHRLLFGTADDAREEYFGRLQRLARKGYIDASAAEAV